MNYKFKYEKLSSGSRLEQFLTTFDNFITEPAVIVRPFFRAGVYIFTSADIAKDVHCSDRKLRNYSMHQFLLENTVAVVCRFRSGSTNAT